jgi:hypothetical protein
MRGFGFAVLGLFAATPTVAGPLDLFPGIYTNEEDVYFAADAKRTPPAYIAINIVREGNALRLRAIDTFGKPLEEGHVMTVTGDVVKAGDCSMPFRAEGAALVALPRTGDCRNHSIMARVAAGGITLTLPDGSTTMLRRARSATCWGAVLKTARKPDGSEDWYGTYGIRLHDQGGRAQFGGGDSGAPVAIVRMRNVIWPSGPNKPSLVLYVHTPDQPDHAVSYSWADPVAKRIGINLRWMQASCNIDTPEGGK